MVQIKNTLYLNRDGSVKLETWLHHASIQRNKEDFQLIRQASILSQIVGESIMVPATQISCLQQGLTMAEILLDLHLDKETIAAALMYSCVNDANLSLATVKEHLGSSVTKLIEGARKMNAIRCTSTSALSPPAQLENIRKMLLAMVEDMRVVLIKLAERTAAMRSLARLEKKDGQAYAQETLDIYAPLANRLGVGQLQWELEDLALHYLDPQIYSKIAQLLQERLIDRESYVKVIISQLRILLVKQLDNFEISGRAKHIHSIYKKMQKKKLKFEELYDLNAIRILVNAAKDCYHVLSIVHNLWPPLAGQFDDYIATPKPNGYQSIHTAVLGPEKKILEIQIRTHQMHQESEHGLAAHWQYKENTQKQEASYQTKIAWLRQVLEWQKELVKQGKATIPDLTTVLDDRVYVFTPKGDILDLPKGSTPLDFAYHIHSEVGHHCRGAKIGGCIVPLTYQLKIGDQIEILTYKEGSPRLDWLNPNLGYLYTDRAKAKVQYWFKTQSYVKHVLNGEELLNKELQRLSLTLDQEKLAQQLHYKTRKEMLAALGTGDLRLSRLLNAVPYQERQIENYILAEPDIILAKPRSTLAKGITVEGITGLLTQIARCCKPVPGDVIKGFITRSRGIILHRSDCNQLLKLQPEKQKRLVDAAWGPIPRQAYPVDIYIEACDRTNLLHELSRLVATEKLNLLALTLSSGKTQDLKIYIKLTIEISSLPLLQKVLGRIKQIPNVLEVKR